jgi:hypothetical protein
MTTRRTRGTAGTAILFLSTLAITAGGADAGPKDGCGSWIKPHEKARAIMADAMGRYQLPRGMVLDTVTIPITWHIVRMSNGTGGKDPAELQGHLDALNEAYEPAGMEFCAPGEVQFIDSNSWHNGLPTYAAVDILRSTDQVSGTINIYWAPSMVGGSLCGISSFTFSDVQAIAMQNTCQGYDEINGVLVHEMGHYFDLFHTFETAFGQECVNGFNCATAGDLICDTPASFGVQFETCVDAGSCTLLAGCSNFTGPCNGDPAYNPDVLNFMSYSAVPCLSTMTMMQYDRARATLLNGRPELLGFSCPSPCFADISGDGVVGVNDLLAVISAWGACNNCPEDLDDNGAVGVDDLLAVIQAWGDCSSG